jgi:hypothetical protein
MEGGRVQRALPLGRVHAQRVTLRNYSGSKLKMKGENNMKTTITARTSVFLIVTILFSLPFALSVPAAEEGALISASIVKACGDMENIQVYTIRNSGGWALATLTYDDENRGTRRASALLKKTGTSWQFMQSSGKTPTTDLLKQNNVPSNYWGDLIEDASISKTRPILAFLHSKYPRQSFECVEMSGDYALATWYGGEDSGMTLLRKSGTSWKVMLSTGGVIDASTMRQYSVPAQHIRPLIGIQ